jgi:hypothetical protein
MPPASLRREGLGPTRSVGAGPPNLGIVRYIAPNFPVLKCSHPEYLPIHSRTA